MIRSATPRDIPEIARLGEEFHAEAGWGDIVPFDLDSFTASLEMWVDNPAWRVIVWDDGGVQGFICGVVIPLYFNSSTTVAQELLWWVKPDRRNGIGAELLAAFHHGADFGFQTVSETIPRTAVVQRKLKMSGWRPVERNFIRRLR